MKDQDDLNMQFKREKLTEMSSVEIYEDTYTEEIDKEGTYKHLEIKERECPIAKGNPKNLKNS